MRTREEDRLDTRAFDRARVDAVCGDPRRPQFHRQRLRETHQPPLGRGVGDAIRIAESPASEDITMIEAAGLCASYGIARCVTMNVPVRLTATTAFHVSSG